MSLSIRRLLSTLLLSLPATLGVLAACDDSAGTSAQGDDEIATLVEAGKADNFYAVEAQEYYVEGRWDVTLDSDWRDASEDEMRGEVQRLIPFKQVVMGWFLNTYLVDKESEDDKETYGGFKALTKNGSYEDMEISQDDADPLVWHFNFRQEVGGQLDLIEALPDAKAQADGSWTFSLIVGRVDNDTIQRLDTDREWYRSAPWGSFNPAGMDASKLETIELTIRPEPASSDAWIDSNRLFADGKLTVGLHFGWDYYKAYHEVHSREVYDWLIRKGFTSPVDSYDDLAFDAGPLTRTITYDGRDIAVEVSIFWGRKGQATDPDTAAGGRQLEADMLDSLANREVVAFNGHSGPFYGFALANWRKTSEGDLDDTELANVLLNVGNYQMILAEGCDTYALGQAFYNNPTKTGLEDLDIITTTSFSNAASSAAVTDLLSALIGDVYTKQAEPTTVSDLIRDLDSNSGWFATMYGVHGIDDNPTVHPLADTTLICESCARHRDCGDGMRCVGMNDGTRACAAECTASTGCGQGFECRYAEYGGYLRDRVCVPTSLNCTDIDDGITMVINEVMARPDADYNGDGDKSSTQDEYIELYNASSGVVDLAGWTLADGVGTRHTFGEGTLVAPGGAIVVFGGGQAKLTAGTSVVQIADTRRLALNNGGDRITLSDPDGLAVDTMSYTSSAPGVSSQRKSDGDIDSAWIDGDATPGAAQDGGNF